LGPPFNSIKAVIFDVDGTLYDQKKMRLKMLWEMGKSTLINFKTIKELLIVWKYRRFREENLTNAVQQYRRTAQATRTDVETVRQVVQDWLINRPLPYLAGCRYPGVLELFAFLRDEGVGIGVFSDYPAREKLAGLELQADAIVWSAEETVNHYKPGPEGLVETARRLEIPVENCLFIGDRDDLDGECARRAGMPYLILDRKKDFMEQVAVFFPKLREK